MIYELYINGVLFESFSDASAAFAHWQDWVDRCVGSVRLRFKRTQPLAGV